MSLIVQPKLKFKPSTAADVAGYKVRQTADYTAAAVTLAKIAADPDGFVRYPVSSIPFLAGKEGTVTIFVSAVDGAGNESDFLTVTGPLDVSPPAAPTVGSFE